jgi:hypothetical protein
VQIVVHPPVPGENDLVTVAVTITDTITSITISIVRRKLLIRPIRKDECSTLVILVLTIVNSYPFVLSYTVASAIAGADTQSHPDTKHQPPPVLSAYGAPPIFRSDRRWSTRLGLVDAVTSTANSNVKADIARSRRRQSRLPAPGRGGSGGGGW